jgi:hypothetical protein
MVRSEVSGSQCERDTAALAALARALRRLDRYERDALARRKCAIRAYDAAMMAACVPPLRAHDFFQNEANFVLARGRSDWQRRRRS